MTVATAAKDWLAQHGHRVARLMLGGGGVAGDIDIRVLQRWRGGIIMSATAGREKLAIKVFDPAAPESRAAFERETSMLMALRGTALVPDIKAMSRKDLFIVSTWQARKTLLDCLQTENRHAWMVRLGEWYAAYSKAVPSKAAQTNWFAHLSRYDVFRDGEALTDHEASLSGMPVTRFEIAKNDAYLRNFVVTGDDVLLGIDFESATLKPFGWDVLITATDLLSAFPAHAEELVAAFVSAWAEHAGVPDPDSYRALAMLYAERVSQEQ